MRWRVTFAVEMDMVVDTDNVDIAKRAEFETDNMADALFGTYGNVDVTVMNIDLVYD